MKTKDKLRLQRRTRIDRAIKDSHLRGLYSLYFSVSDSFGILFSNLLHSPERLKFTNWYNAKNPHKKISVRRLNRTQRELADGMFSPRLTLENLKQAIATMRRIDHQNRVEPRYIEWL